MAGILKSLTPLFHPLGLVWFGLLIAAVVCLVRKSRIGAIGSAAAALILWLPAQPPIAARLLGSLEKPWLEHTLADAPEADAVIVLGGGWRSSSPGFVGLDLTPAADRFITGVELYRRGKAKTLVVGGDPWHPPAEIPVYSEQLDRWLNLWGLTKAPIKTLGPVRSTREEALKARELAEREGWKRVLLVTSAFHMRRSMAAFEKAGVSIDPVACDFQVQPRLKGRPGWRLFPDEEAFFAFGLWWHEEVGWLAYSMFEYL